MHPHHARGGMGLSIQDARGMQSRSTRWKAFPMSEPDRLLILIVRSEEGLDAIVTGLVDAGIGGATVVDSRGLAAIVRDELPIFSGLGSLLPVETGSRVILSLADQKQVEKALTFVEDLPDDIRPIGAVVPVLRAIGLRNLAERADRS